MRPNFVSQNFCTNGRCTKIFHITLCYGVGSHQYQARSWRMKEFERACCIQGYDGPLGSSWQAIQVATNPSLSFTRMNISNCKNFVVLIVCCRKYFECLIFVLYLAYENILAPKIFQTTVLSPFHAWHWSLHNIFNILQLAGAHSVRIQFHHQIPSASGTRTRPA